MAVRTSNSFASKLFFRSLYSGMKKKGRLAMMIGAIVVCALGLIIGTVGCIMMQSEGNIKVPLIVSIVGFILLGIGISFSSMVSDAAYHHDAYNEFKRLFGKEESDIAPANEMALDNEITALKALDRKIGLACALTSVLTVVLAIVIVTLVFIL